MAPRRRLKRPRLSRIDAAVEAIAPLGYSKKLVQQTMKQLLKQYSGDEGWHFIEQDCYKVLVEALLDQEVCAQGANELLNAPSSHAQTAGCPESTGEIAQIDWKDVEVVLDQGQNRQNEILDPIDAFFPPILLDSSTAEDQIGWKDIVVDPKSHSETLPARARRRRPCYGWLTEDDDEDSHVEFIYLPSTANVLRARYN